MPTHCGVDHRSPNTWRFMATSSNSETPIAQHFAMSTWYSLKLKIPFVRQNMMVHIIFQCPCRWFLLPSLRLMHRFVKWWARFLVICIIDWCELSSLPRLASLVSSGTTLALKRDVTKLLERKNLKRDWQGLGRGKNGLPVAGECMSRMGMLSRDSA